MPSIVPVSAILPTRNRAPILERFLESLTQQEALPAEVVICDSSDDGETEAVVNKQRGRFTAQISIVYQKAQRTGLAPQRNQAVATSTQPFAWFLDDDMILEPGCLRQLYDAVNSSARIGGVTATLINEAYHPPGRLTQRLMRFFENGQARSTYASSCIGPGWTFLHDADPHGPALMPSEWLGGGCTLYRQEALPEPAVPDHFEAGALGEDLAASLTVGHTWEMYHVRAARAVHDSQGGDHKSNFVKHADQTLRNRYFIMTRVMGKDSLRDVLNLALMHAFIGISQLRHVKTWRRAGCMMLGWSLAIYKMATQPAHPPRWPVVSA
jgi:GT2 family glycosyltransferase